MTVSVPLLGLTQDSPGLIRGNPACASRRTPGSTTNGSGIRLSSWVTSREQKWVSFGERRSFYKPIDEDVVSSFIPPPLKRLKRTPMISIFIQQRNVNGGKGNDALNEGYLEKITGAMVMHEGKLGFYPISILIESDMGAMLGRELFGTAKKVGRFNFERDGDSFKWQVYRREILLAELSGRISDEEVDSGNVEQLMEAPSYHLHQVPSCTLDAGDYAYAPRLMRNYPALRKIHKLRACDDIRFNFNESPFDPICLMGPKEIYAVSYLNADTTLGPIEVVRDLDPEAMAPFIFCKLDPF